MKSYSITCVAPTNIALVKYWGKRQDSKDLNVPLNDSLSLTLNAKHLHTITKVETHPSLTEDSLSLNHCRLDSLGPRVTRVLDEIRKRLREKDDRRCDWKVSITSENSFPTAAGLASSASGYAALSACLYRLFDLGLFSNETHVERKKSLEQVSKVARLGSGSACRSVHGGFVHWIAGHKRDGSDSLALSINISPDSSLHNIHVLVCVMSDVKKKVASSEGMQRSSDTSYFLTYRSQVVVPHRMKEILSALETSNFDSLAHIAMSESNQFHAVCLDTLPPIFYLNEASQAVISSVHSFNEFMGKEGGEACSAFYTFDAGANAVLVFSSPRCAAIFQKILLRSAGGQNDFPQKVDKSVGSNDFIRGLELELENCDNLVVDRFLERFPGITKFGSGIKYVIATNLDEEGVRIGDVEESDLEIFQ